jgi:hypothetical protein
MSAYSKPDSVHTLAASFRAKTFVYKDSESQADEEVQP